MNGDEDDVSIRVAPMFPADIPLVFPLLQLHDPCLTQRVWQRRGMRLAQVGELKKKGVILARYAEWPGPCAAAFYQVEAENTRRKRLLSVEMVTAAMLGTAWPAMRELARASTRIATRFGCEETRLQITTDNPALISRFRTEGFADGVILLHKNLTSPELSKN